MFDKTLYLYDEEMWNRRLRQLIGENRARLVTAEEFRTEAIVNLAMKYAVEKNRWTRKRVFSYALREQGEVRCFIDSIFGHSLGSGVSTRAVQEREEKGGRDRRLEVKQ